MSNLNYQNENEGDDDQSYKQFEIHEGIAFLIELSPEIMLPLKELNYKSQLFEILSSINDLMSELIITLPNTGIGIYFYNCEKTPLTKSMKIPGFSRLFSLNDLNVPNMKILNDLIIDDINKIKSIEKRIIHEPNKDSEQLQLILNKMLDELNKKKQYNNKKLIWFTNNDKPFSKNSTKENLWRIINDFESFNYFISPIYLDKFKDSDQTEKITFNMKLYQDIFLNTNYLKNNGSRYYNSLVFNGISKESPVFKNTLLSKKIRSAIFRLKEIRRILFSCNLILGDGKESKLGSSVKGYALYSHEKIKKFKHVYTKSDHPKTVYLDTKIINQETNEEIKLDEDASKSIPERRDYSNIRKGFQLSGGDILYLNLEQQDFLKNYAFDHTPDDLEIKKEEGEEDIEYDDDDDDISFSIPPYLKLLGFRDISKFKPYYISSPPIFVTADMNDGLRSTSTNGGFRNSFTTFSSLYQSCVKLRKFGVLFGCTKKNALPNLYAFYPTRIENSTRNINHQKEFPEGFLLIRLPWLDDIRSLPNHISTDDQYLSNHKIPKDILDKYKQLISNFYYNQYSPNDFPNPSLNYFYKMIKYNLLQIELSNNSKNLIKNDITALKLFELRNSLVNDLSSINLVKGLNYALNKLGNNEVIKRTNEFNESLNKKLKIEPLDENAVLTAWKNNQWKYFTVSQLKDFVKRYQGKIKSANKKQDLIDNITEFLNSRAKI